MVINDTRIKNEIVHFTEKIMNYIKNKIGSRFLKMLKYQTKSSIQPIWVFQKIPNIQRNILDSPYIISRVNLYNKNFNVIREDLLISGPIQRIIEKILRDIKEHNLFLRCKINEYSQVALSYGCFILKKKCHLILNKQYDNKLHKLSILAKIFGAKIHFIERQTDKNIEKKNIIQAIQYLGKIIGVFSNRIAVTLTKEEKVFNEKEINLLIKKRNEARKNKDYKLALKMLPSIFPLDEGSEGYEIGIKAEEWWIKNNIIKCMLIGSAKDPIIPLEKMKILSQINLFTKLIIHLGI